MFDFDRLYWPPFTRRRGFDEEQWVTVWSEYDGRPEPTAIPIIDSVVERLHEGRPAAGGGRVWHQQRRPLDGTARTDRHDHTGAGAGMAAAHGGRVATLHANADWRDSPPLRLQQCHVAQPLSGTAHGAVAHRTAARTEKERGFREVWSVKLFISNIGRIQKRTIEIC